MGGVGLVVVCRMLNMKGWVVRFLGVEGGWGWGRPKRKWGVSWMSFGVYMFEDVKGTRYM